MKIQHFFEPETSALSYLVYDEPTRIGVLIDTVLDYDPASGRISPPSAEAIAAFVDAAGLKISHVLDTHVHADHLTAARWFAERYGAKTVIGAEIGQMQDALRDELGLPPRETLSAQGYDVLVEEGDTIDVGPFEVCVFATPGHTPGCSSYAIGDALFVGDLLFMPDYGTARCDFPGGSPEQLYRSIQRVYRELPAETRVFTGHDYRPGGRALRFESSLREQREKNVQLTEETAPEEFIAFREARDAELEMPRLFIPSIQINLRAGHLPAPASNGISYLQIPLNHFGADR